MFIAKLARALFALTVLAGLLVGLPAALVTFGTSPVRGQVSTDSLRDLLAEPTSDRAIAGLLTLAAWLVWALFVRALVVEVAASRRARTPSASIAPLPARRVGPLRWLARSLVLWLTMTAGSVGSLASIGASAPALSAVLAVDHAQPVAAAVAPDSVPRPDPVVESGTTSAVPAGRRIVVADATDAWTVANQHLGSGERWRELWSHNRDHRQPDGRRWGDPEATIEPGWELFIPATTTPPMPAPTSAEPTPAPQLTVEVVEHDDFWHIAEHELATAWGRAPTDAEITPYWQQLVEANRDRLAPPGDPNVIYPGQTFVVPPPGPDPAARATPAPAAPETSSSTPPAGEVPLPEPSAPSPDSMPAPPPAPSSVPSPGSEAPATTETPAPSHGDDPSMSPSTSAGDPGPSSTTDTPVSIEHAWPVGLAAGGIGLAGVVVLLDRRRRAQQRHRPRGHRLPAPPPGMERSENQLRARVDMTGARLVEVALRAAAAGAGSTGLPALRWVEVETDPTSVLLVLGRPAIAPRGFVAEGPDRWRTAVPSDDLAVLGSQVAFPAPTLVPVGTAPAGAEILVDLESSGVVTVSGPLEVTAGFMRALATAVATVPWNTQPQVLLAGMTGELCALPWVQASASLGDALAAAEFHAARTATTLRDLDCATAGQARASGEVPDAWDPLVVISAQQPHDLEDRRLAGLAAQPQHAVAVVTPPGTVPPHGRAFTLDASGRLRIDGIEQTIAARVLDESDARVVVDLLERATKLDATVPATALDDETIRRAPAATSPPPEPADPAERRLDTLLADVEVLIRVLGEIEVVRLGPAGEEPLLAERQKGLEALVYMALRESAVDRDDLQAALFPAGANAVKTFHNTVSAARVMVGEHLLPHATSGRYELSDRVVTDYGLFCDLVDEAEDNEDPETAAGLLHEALSLVRGEPFTGVGRGYSWVSGHCGMIVAQVVDAAEELAEVSLATDDWHTAEWAARQGLAAFPCDERMYRLLMRTAKTAGNTPGVKRAFRELCEAIADPDDGVEPIDTVHPDTIALLEELTHSNHRMGA